MCRSPILCSFVLFLFFFVFFCVLMYDFIINKKYVLWNVYLPNALNSVCLSRLSCTEIGIYNGANSPNGFLTLAVA